MELLNNNSPKKLYVLIEQRFIPICMYKLQINPETEFNYKANSTEYAHKFARRTKIVCLIETPDLKIE